MNAATLDRSALAEAVDRYEPDACDSCPRDVSPSARPGNLRMAYTARTAAQECEPTLRAPLSSPARVRSATSIHAQRIPSSSMKRMRA